VQRASRLGEPLDCRHRAADRDGESEAAELRELPIRLEKLLDAPSIAL
jgi:hypothetical protein